MTSPNAPQGGRDNDYGSGATFHVAFDHMTHRWCVERWNGAGDVEEWSFDTFDQAENFADAKAVEEGAVRV